MFYTYMINIYTLYELTLQGTKETHLNPFVMCDMLVKNISVKDHYNILTHIYGI